MWPSDHYLLNVDFSLACSGEGRRARDGRDGGSPSALVVPVDAAQPRLASPQPPRRPPSMPPVSADPRVLRGARLGPHGAWLALPGSAGASGGGDAWQARRANVVQSALARLGAREPSPESYIIIIS